MITKEDVKRALLELWPKAKFVDVFSSAYPTDWHRPDASWSINLLSKDIAEKLNEYREEV